MSCKSACVVAGSIPSHVASVEGAGALDLVETSLGTLVTGTLGDFPIDAAVSLPGPVYDVMYSSRTGWFAVTVYRGEDQPVRWDNRPGEEAGYPRIADILGATTPATILAVLEIPADAIGYLVS